jgi:hypothetical protein
MDERKWDTMSKREQDALIEECWAYDEKLARNGQWVDGGQALQSIRTAKTLRAQNGKVVATDGPYAETKEQLGGTGVLEARDMDHAVELMSRHPGVRLAGSFEIRPVREKLAKGEPASETDPESTVAEVVATHPGAETRKFICLGYADEKLWATLSAAEQDALNDQCTGFHEQCSQNGQWVTGITLEGSRTAKTVRAEGGKVFVTDGPFAETKEQLAGLIVVAVKDMNEAIELFSAHGHIRDGTAVEIRPADLEMNARWEARRERIQAAHASRA